jgi:hypothetical protein
MRYFVTKECSRKKSRSFGRGAGILLFFILALFIASVSGAVSNETVVSEAQVAVSEVRLDPEIFMQDDTGTLAVTISNSGTETIDIDRVELLSDKLRVVNYQTYDQVGLLGSKNSLRFTFMIDADVEDGTYFPIFYVDVTGAGSLRYPVPVRVDDTDIMVSVVDAPSTFYPGSKEEITLSVGNSRENEVTSVSVTPEGEGIRTTQSSLFIGTLQPDEKKDVTFEVSASKGTDLVFDVSWRNGPNEHHTLLTLPVVMGERRVAAELVVNSVEVTQAGSSVTIKGDVTNAGLKDAKAVTVTTGAPAKPIDPNPVYVIGALEPDDFSSFEVTCTAPGASTVPLLIEYRDDEGDGYQETVDISLRNAGQASSGSGTSGSGQTFNAGGPGGQGNNRQRGGFFSFGSGVSRIPFLEIAVVIIGCVAVLVAWRKGYVKKIGDRFRK